jgi:tRNA(Arg) A34 adenosine deaminase TadA
MTEKQLEEIMHKALDTARVSTEKGEGGPFGAAIIKEGQIIALAANQVKKNNDPTAHAEIMAIRAACQYLGQKKLEGCILVSTCEPCPMCYSAIHFSGIRQVYFAALHKEAGQIAGFGMEQLYQDLAQPPTQRKIVQQQVFKEAGWRLLQEWKDANR